MKKRLLMMAIMLVAALGLFGNKAYAIEKNLTEQEMSSAVNADMGKDYSINWKYGVDNAINKVTIPQKGIFTITTPKLTSKSLGLLATRVAVYDAKGNFVWECKDATENANPTYYVGLNAGNYYTLVEIIYSSYAWDRASTYRFGFEANEYVETEPNSTKETASPIVTDVPYSGWIGSGFAETNGLDDGYDIYKVNLIKGQTYKLISNAEQTGKNTLCLWSEKDKAIADHWANITETNAYVAKYTGVHYISVYNYGGEQYKYTVEVRTLNKGLAAPKITSLKAGKKSFTVKWNKVKCSGYQVEYATNKQMKKSTKKTISKAATTKLQVKKLKAKKKYYVRVRAYKTEKGKKNYSDWSEVKSITTKK